MDELASLAQRGMAKGAGVVGGGEGEGATAVDALLVLSLCHTVVMEKKEDGTQDYQVQSLPIQISLLYSRVFSY